MLREIHLKILGIVSFIMALGFFDQILANPEVQVMRNLPSMSLLFSGNRGQWDERVLFRAKAGGTTIWFAAEGIYYQFARRMSKAGANTDDLLHQGSHQHGRESNSVETMMVKLLLEGANPNLRITGHDMKESKCNYFIGNDSDNWHTNVPNYSSIKYIDVYPGIDLKYYSNGRQMEYDFMVAPRSRSRSDLHPLSRDRVNFNWHT